MQSEIQKIDPLVSPPAFTDQKTARDYDEILPYAEYENRGRKVKAIIDASPMKDKTVKPPGQLLAIDKKTECASLSDGYNCEKAPVWFSYDENLSSRLPFLAFGIQPGTKFTQMTWRAKKEAKTKLDKKLAPYVHIAAYNAKEGAIVMSLVYAKNDGWPDDAPRRNYCSEITWQSWKKIAGSECANLKLIIQENVQSCGTRFVIEEAYKRQQPPLNPWEIATFAMDPVDIHIQSAFLALLGTDNARPMEYMFADHFNEAGQKKIQSITVFPWKGDLQDLDWHMALIIDKDIVRDSETDTALTSSSQLDS